MKSRSLLWVPVVLMLVSLGYSLAPAANQAGGSQVTVAGVVMTDTNIRNRQKGIPDRWAIDLGSDGRSDFTLISSGEELAGSELAIGGVRIEAVVEQTDRRKAEYELISWVRIGDLR